MSNQKILTKITFGIFLVFLLWAGIFLSTKNWNIFEPEPEKVIEESIKKMKDLKTFSFQVNLNFIGKEKEKEVFKTTISFKNNIDKSDSTNSKLSGDFNLGTVFSNLKEEEKKMQYQFSFAGENKIIGPIVYFKLTDLPSSDFLERILQVTGIKFADIQNQWIKFDEKNFLKSILYQDAQEEIMTQELQERKEVKEGVVKRVEELFRIYKVKKSLPKEEIDGVKLRHYLINLDKEEIKTALPDLFYAMGWFLGPEVIMDEGVLQDLLPRIKEFLEITDEIPAEIWIGQRDGYLYKIKIGQEVNFGRLTGSFERGKVPDVTSSSVILEADINFSNFNQSFNIESPVNSKNLEDVISPDFYPDYFEILFYEGEI